MLSITLLLSILCSIYVDDTIADVYAMRMNRGRNANLQRAGVVDTTEVPTDALRILARLIAKRHLSGKRERDDQAVKDNIPKLENDRPRGQRGNS